LGDDAKRAVQGHGVLHAVDEEGRKLLVSDPVVRASRIGTPGGVKRASGKVTLRDVERSRKLIRNADAPAEGISLSDNPALI
jgi:hypothetical protein